MPEFFKLRAFGTDTERLRVRQMLFEGQLKFSSTIELNDPFEGRPTMVAAHDNPVLQEAALREYFILVFMSEGSLTREAAEAEYKQRRPLTQRPGFAPMDYLPGTIQAIKDLFWVYSVTATRDPILLWSHYADGHRGVCIHFNRERLPFSAALPVSYSDTLPAIPFPRTAINTEQLLERTILTKATLWKYEEEHRVVRTRAPANGAHQIFREYGLQWQNSVARIPLDVITGVTLGIGCDGPAKEQLVAEIRERRPDLPIWKATPSASSFALEFNLLALAKERICGSELTS